MPVFIPTRTGHVLLNVDRVDYFRIGEVPDKKWVTEAVLAENHHLAVATHDSYDDAHDSLIALLDRHGLLGG